MKFYEVDYTSGPNSSYLLYPPYLLLGPLTLGLGHVTCFGQ